MKIKIAKKHPGKLFYHKTSGGAEYLCTKPVKGTNEGDLNYAAVRLDGAHELLGKYVAVSELAEALKFVLSQLDPENDHPKTQHKLYSDCLAPDSDEETVVEYIRRVLGKAGIK